MDYWRDKSTGIIIILVLRARQMELPLVKRIHKYIFISKIFDKEYVTKYKKMIFSTNLAEIEKIS